MALTTLTQKNFDDCVGKNKLVIVDFWAEYCAPCKSFAQVMENLSKKYPDVVFASVNVEEEPQLAEEFEVRSVPFVMILREKVIVYADSGALSESALDEMIDQAKALNGDQL